MGHLHRLHRSLVKQGIRQMGENPTGQTVMAEVYPVKDFTKTYIRELYYYNRLPDRLEGHPKPTE